MAPDKIFVTERKKEEDINGFFGTAWTFNDDSCKHIEYIRKDALLEWAKEIKKQEEGLERAGYGRVFYGARIAIIDEVINKINSM